MHTDIFCPANITGGAYDTVCFSDTDGSNGKTGGANNYSYSGTKTNFCAETWNIAAQSMRCVRAQYTAERLMKTEDNGGSSPPVTAANSVDIDFKLRKYSVTTGW